MIISHCPKCDTKVKTNLLDANKNTVILGWACPKCDYGGITTVSGHAYTVDDDGEELRS